MKELAETFQRQTFYIREDQALWLLSSQLRFREESRTRVGVSELVRAALDLAKEELASHERLEHSKIATSIPLWGLKN